MVDERRNGTCFLSTVENREVYSEGKRNCKNDLIDKKRRRVESKRHLFSAPLIGSRD